MLPWSITVTRWQRPITNSMLCSTTRKVRPCLFSSFIWSEIALSSVRFTPPAGSSRSRTSGSDIKHISELEEFALAVGQVGGLFAGEPGYTDELE